jgi:hypothetical protein
MEEDERRAIREDPRTIAAFRAQYERKVACEAEERRQAEEARRQREAAARWEEEKKSRKRHWVDAGEKVAGGSRNWPRCIVSRARSLSLGIFGG